MVWRCLTENLRDIVPSPWLQILLALISVAGGAIVGTEREKREKPAGLRTLILVCLGSTAFTIASFAFTTTTGDSGRVAAQIVTGIGFLGAGAILHGTGMIRGMTTAATIWGVAAIGMVVGIGHGGGGLGLALLMRLVLSFALRWEGHAVGGEQESRVQLVFDANGGKTRIQIEKVLEDYHISEPLTVDESGADGRVRATFRFRLHRQHGRELLAEIARMPAVTELKELKP